MRYSPQELKQAATIVLNDKTKNGQRSFRLTLEMCIITGLAAEDVLARIEDLTRA